MITVYAKGLTVQVIDNVVTPPSGETLAVDVATKFQTMRGWEATAIAFGINKQQNMYDPTWLTCNAQVMQRLVNDGVDRLQLPVRSGWQTAVDYFPQFQSGAINYNQLGTHWYTPTAGAPYQWGEFDFNVTTKLLPMRAAMAARGETLYTSFIFTDFGTKTGGAFDFSVNPAAYAAFIKAYMDRLRDVHGVTLDAIDVVLEPDNSGGWMWGQRIGNAIAALRTATQSQYPNLHFIAPSFAAAYNVVQTMNDMQTLAPAGFASVGTVAYHRYGGGDADAVAVKNWAYARGRLTAMSELFTATIDTLLSDLIDGGVSHWQKWSICGRLGGSINGYYIVDSSVSPAAITFAPNASHMSLIFPYVRMNAKRVSATSSIAMKCVAFENANGKRAVHAKRTTANPAANVTVTGLVPNAVHGVRFIAGGSTTPQNGADVTSNASGWAVVNLAPGYTTLYQK